MSGGKAWAEWGLFLSPAAAPAAVLAASCLSPAQALMMSNHASIFSPARHGYKYRIVDGLMVPPYVTPSRYNASRSVVTRPTDVCYCSFPKSGSTWLATVLYLMLNDGVEPEGRPLRSNLHWCAGPGEWQQWRLGRFARGGVPGTEARDAGLWGCAPYFDDAHTTPPNQLTAVDLASAQSVQAALTHACTAGWRAAGRTPAHRLRWTPCPPPASSRATCHTAWHWPAAPATAPASKCGISQRQRCLGWLAVLAPS